MVHNPFLFKLIHFSQQVGANASVEKRAELCEMLDMYIHSENQDEALVEYLNCMKENNKEGKEERDKFFYAQFHAMSRLYKVAGFSPNAVKKYINQILMDDPYFNYMMELFLRFEQKPVKISDDSHAHCPTCGADLSVQMASGNIVQPSFMTYCPYCRQSLKWQE